MPIVKRQLLVAGIRLAAILNKLFVSTTSEVDMKSVAEKYVNGIEAKDAINNVGKTVTVCGKVYGIKSTDKVTFINVGNRYPKSPLTIVIFTKNKVNFQPSIEALYADRNICILGNIISR